MTASMHSYVQIANAGGHFIGCMDIITSPEYTLENAAHLCQTLSDH